MTQDLVVRDASVPGIDGRTAVGVTDGRIERVEPGLADADRVVDADGGLLAGGFVDPHTHLDKALLADSLRTNESRTLAEAIAIDTGRKAGETAEEIRARAERTIEMHVRNGCTRLRTHVDVDPVGELTALEGVLAARRATADVADVQVVAFPQEGLLSAPGTEELLREALAAGADVVGGMPASERTEARVQEHVDRLLALATEYDRPVDMHVDETDDPTARSLEYLASRTIEEGLEGSVTAGHVCALAAYDESHARRVVDLVAEAGLNVVTNPSTNLMLQGRDDQHPKRRGLTRIDQLQAAGVPVAAGQDNIRDAFYQYNRADMLDTAFLVANAAHLQAPAEREAVWEMVTGTAAEVIGVPHGVEVGAPATFNLFPPAVGSRTEALRERRPPALVVHDGRIVARNETERSLVRGGS